MKLVRYNSYILLNPSSLLTSFHVDFGHLDFILGVDANVRIFPMILQLIDKANGHAKN